MTLSEKQAYLKGLADGMKLDEGSDEIKLINGIIDLLGGITEAIDEIDDDLETLNDYIEEVSSGDPEVYEELKKIREETIENANFFPVYRG